MAIYDLEAVLNLSCDDLDEFLRHFRFCDEEDSGTGDRREGKCHYGRFQHIRIP